MAGWFVGWLVGWLGYVRLVWLTVLLVGWLVVWLVGWLGGWLFGCLIGWLVTKGSDTSFVVLSNSSGKIPVYSLITSRAYPASLPHCLISANLLNSNPPFLAGTTSSVSVRASLIVYMSCLIILVTLAGQPSISTCRRVAPFKIRIHTHPYGVK